MKKHYLIIAVFILLTVGSGVLALNKYAHQPKGITLSQAVNQRNDALNDLSIAKQLDSVHEQAAIKQINDLKTNLVTVTAQNATLCIQIKAAKLVQPLCK